MGKKVKKKSIENAEPALATIPEESEKADNDEIKDVDKSSGKKSKSAIKVLKSSDNLPESNTAEDATVLTKSDKKPDKEDGKENKKAKGKKGKGKEKKDIVESAEPELEAVKSPSKAPKSSDNLEEENVPKKKKSSLKSKEKIKKGQSQVSYKEKKGKKSKADSGDAKEEKKGKDKSPKKAKEKIESVKSDKEIQVQADKELTPEKEKSIPKSMLKSKASIVQADESKIKSKTSFKDMQDQSTHSLRKKKSKRSLGSTRSHSLLDTRGRSKSETSQHKSFLMIYGHQTEDSSSDDSEEYEEEKTEMSTKKKKDKKKKQKPESDEKPKKDKQKADKKDKKEKKEKKDQTAAEAKPKKKKEGTSKSGDPEQDLLKKKLEEVKKRALEKGITDVKEAEEGPKKKMSKKEKAKITAEMAEKAKQEMEAQMKRLEEMIRKKEEEERLAAIEKDKKETHEQNLRMEQLAESFALIDDLNKSITEKTKEENELIEWKKYVACGQLPNAAQCDQMNTYLHLWEQMLDTTNIEDTSSRTKDVITLINELDELIDIANKEKNQKLDNWKWIRQLFREHQSTSLDVTTYKLLRDVEHNLNRINIPTADFNFKDDYVTLCIWLRVMLPIPLPNPRRPPKPRIDVSFEIMDVSILFPIIIDCENSAIRAMYLKYDHLSDLSETYYMPEVPKEYYMNLLESCQKEWRKNLKYKYSNRDKKVPQPKVEAPIEDTSLSPEPTDQQTDNPNKSPENEKIVETPEPEDFNSDEDIPVVPFKQLKPTASEYVISQEDEIYMDTRTMLALILPENVINLRKFVILGGVYNFNLLAQPPQPQDFITMEMTLTGLYLPKKLEVLPFKVVYKPYIPPETTAPKVEESLVANITSSRKITDDHEDEIKKQEEALDKLIFINIKWPQHVIFLELPIVCRWDEEKKLWSKEEIIDVRHNEEKCIISFRTGVFGVYGLATYRYANLPFQAYDIKPEVDGSVTVQLTAAILMLEFNVKDGLICITQLQNSPNMTLQDIIGQYFKLHKLKRMMKDAGIDIFPAFDAFCYVHGTCEKQWPMEKHLYYNMAQMANTFNFAWSRWNLQAGRRRIVLQMRQYLPEKGKQKNHQMLLVTPLKATFVDCTEVSQSFSDKEVESLKFCADLYHLMKSTSGIFVRNKVMKASKESVYTLAQFLISTRILSFS
ncbi:dynein axonemal intermediate chain 7 [Rhynchophorus ferrugineus]|uniref:dynein axonemal intermediate chain 7 n=1 Tax=Rhynchophorus ferrugineus TaxID=354439 RepID=UPI003FCC35DB